MGLRVPASSCFGWRTEPAPRAGGGLSTTGPPDVYKPPCPPECHHPSPAGAGALAEAWRTGPSADLPLHVRGLLHLSTPHPAKHRRLKRSLCFTCKQHSARVPPGPQQDRATGQRQPVLLRSQRPPGSSGGRPVCTRFSLCQVTSCPYTAPVRTQALTLRFLTWTPSVWMPEANTRVPLGTKPCPGGDRSCRALRSWGIWPKRAFLHVSSHGLHLL